MPRNQESVLVDFKTWVDLTSSDVDRISFQVLRGRVEIRVGETSVPMPTDRGWEYKKGQGERSISLSDIAVSGGARVWALGVSSSGAEVLVDHA